MTKAELTADVPPPEGRFVNPECPPGDRALPAGCIDARRLEAGDLHMMYCPQCDSFHRLAVPPHGVELPPSPLHLWE